MTQCSKVYLKKNHHKRGIKLGEVIKGSSWLEMTEQLPKLKELPTTPYLRFWEIDDETHIDFGSHSALIIVKEWVGIEEFYIIIFIGLAYGVFSVVFDKYMETDKTKHEAIYKIILLIIVITTTGLALKYHLLSTLIVLLAFMFIDKIKMFHKEW